MKSIVLPAVAMLVLSGCGGQGSVAPNSEKQAPRVSAIEVDFSPREQAPRSLPLSDTQQALLVLPPSAAENLKSGERIFKTQCATCHGFGIEQGATQRLERRYDDGQSYALAVRTDLTPGFISTFVRQNTPGMPAFRKAELSDEELDDLLAYLTRNTDPELLQ